MTRAGWVGLIVAWLVSLASVGLVAQTLQRHHDRIYSGRDIGFRIVRQYNGVPMGRLMVRMHGHWTEVAFALQATKDDAR